MPITTGRDRSMTRCPTAPLHGWVYCLGATRRGGRRIVPIARRTRHLAFHDVLDHFLVDGLVLDQGFRHGLQLVHVGLDDLVSALVIAVDHPPHFLVDDMRGDVRHLLVLGDAAAQEHFARLFAVGLRTQAIRQAPTSDHVARQLGGPLDVVGGARGHGIGSEHQFFGHAAAEQRRDAAFQLTLARAVAILFRQEHGDAQRTAARNDGDLVHRVMLGNAQADDGMARLVIGGVALLFLGHDHGAPLGTHHDLVLGALELFHGDRALVAAGGEQAPLR
jgi:hypothetical protein